MCAVATVGLALGLQGAEGPAGRGADPALSGSSGPGGPGEVHAGQGRPDQAKQRTLG